MLVLLPWCPVHVWYRPLPTLDLLEFFELLSNLLPLRVYLLTLFFFASLMPLCVQGQKLQTCTFCAFNRHKNKWRTLWSHPSVPFPSFHVFFMLRVVLSCTLSCFTLLRCQYLAPWYASPRSSLWGILAWSSVKFLLTIFIVLHVWPTILHWFCPGIYRWAP